MKRILFLSGGIDSTGLLFFMGTRNKQVDNIIYVDTTIEFDETKQYIEELNDEIYKRWKWEITTLEPADDFEYFLKHYKKKKGTTGLGVPTLRFLWCRKFLKINTTNDFLEYEGIREARLYFGFTIEEKERYLKTRNQYSKMKNRNFEVSKILIKNGVSREYLKHLVEREFYLNPVYNHYKRCSCYACPLAGKSHFIKLATHHKDLFKKCLKWENYSIRHHKKTFLPNITLKEIKKMVEEEQQNDKENYL